LTSWRPPASQAQRDKLAIAYARDGYALGEAVYDPSAPAWLREIPAVGILRRVLLQTCTRAISADGKEVIKRREKEPEGDGLPHGKARIASPYDTDARRGVKREQFWLGYKLHVTEACDDAPPCDCAHCPGAGGTDSSEPGGPGVSSTGHVAGCASEAFPNLITHVETTDATVPGSQMTSVIDDGLAGKGLAPGRHYVDSGYLSAALAVSEAARHGIALAGPLLADTSAQARAGAGYARADFIIDYDRQAVTCPRGKTATSWTPCAQRGKNAIVAQFSAADCGPCPARSLCTKGKRRQLTLPPRDMAEAQAAARAAEKTIPFQRTAPAAPASREPCTRPPLTERGAHATAGCPKPVSTTCTWPAPSTSCGWKRTGTAPPSTGAEPATSHASDSTSPHDRGISQQSHVARGRRADVKICAGLARRSRLGFARMGR
jgi:hypothetical protein